MIIQAIVVGSIFLFMGIPFTIAALKDETYTAFLYLIFGVGGLSGGFIFLVSGVSGIWWLGFAAYIGIAWVWVIYLQLTE